MYNEEIKLIKELKSINEYGDPVSEKSERMVFAEFKSIGQLEFYQAKAEGLKPEVKFVLPDYLEYQNERKLKYRAYNEAEEQEYTIIRTFRKGKELEIVCERSCGI